MVGGGVIVGQFQCFQPGQPGESGESEEPGEPAEEVLHLQVQGGEGGLQGSIPTT